MSNTLLETKTVNLTEIIGNGKKYKIPSFQRDYSWEESHWEDLWLDMLDVYSTQSAHYMGAIVLQYKQDDFYEVIDGQQRLTTLSIFIIAIIQYLKTLANLGIESDKNNDRADILRRNFIGDKDASSLTYSSKLFLNENNDHFYQSNLVNFKKPIGKLSDSQKLIWACYEFFIDKIEAYFKHDGEKLSIFIEKFISKKLMFIQIKVESDINAYTVFETLNSRGVELTTTDLLKNFLFSQVADSPNDLDYIKREWNEIVNIIGLKDFPTFLRYYINSKYQLVTQRELFKFIKNQINHKEKVIELLKELRLNANIYYALGNKDDDYWLQYPNHSLIKKALGELELFRVNTIKTLLLSCFRNYDIVEFEKILKVTTVVSFRYNVIASKDPKFMEIEYSKLAIKIEAGDFTNIKEVKKYLKNKLYIEDNEFQDIFKNKKIKISNRKLIKYILISIENHLSQTKKDFLSDPATIEHILPESPTDSWKSDFPENIQESFIERVGNYTLLESSINKSSENKIFSEKIEEYKKSKYTTTSSIGEYFSEWNPSSIERRQSYYAEKSNEIWKIEI